VTGRPDNNTLRYKAALLSPLGLMSGATAASAADVPVMVTKAPVAVAVPPSWTGVYGGINLGVISDHSRQSAFLPALPGGNVCWGTDCAFTNRQTATGLLGGVQLGYNFQSGPAVFGLEADFGLSSAKTTTTGVTNFMRWTSETGIDALGTFRGRLGYAFDRVLIYGTGGLAYGKSRNTHKSDSSAAYTWTDRAGWRAGYTAGAGFEYKFDRNWSAKGEFLYYDLGSKDHISVFTPGNTNIGLRDRTNGYVGRVGINYFFFGQ
jgi:outer membrane immunogenic protein